MIKSEIIEIYNWDDIQNEICLRMGIEENQFHDYHEVVGDGYKDLWYIARGSIIPNMANDSIVMLFGIENDEELEFNVMEHGEWTRKFFVVYMELMNELDPNCNGVWVSFSW